MTLENSVPINNFKYLFKKYNLDDYQKVECVKSKLIKYAQSCQ